MESIRCGLKLLFQGLSQIKLIFGEALLGKIGTKLLQLTFYYPNWQHSFFSTDWKFRKIRKSEHIRTKLGKIGKIGTNRQKNSTKSMMS